jgi:predicted choloylglycine hydrolase
VRLILDASAAKEAVEIIKAFNPRIGGNMFVADARECYGIEGVPEKYFIEKTTDSAVKTNHFVNLPNRNLDFGSEEGFEQWSRDHYNRAKELILAASNLKDFQQLLRDRKNAEKKTAICTTRREAECFTHSAFIFDTKNRKVFYCQGNPLENEFKEYGF